MNKDSISYTLVMSLIPILILIVLVGICLVNILPGFISAVLSAYGIILLPILVVFAILFIPFFIGVLTDVTIDRVNKLQKEKDRQYAVFSSDPSFELDEKLLRKIKSMQVTQPSKSIGVMKRIESVMEFVGKIFLVIFIYRFIKNLFNDRS